MGPPRRSMADGTGIGVGAAYEGTLTHTDGAIIGPFERYITTTAQDFLFPVGTDTSENFAIFNFTDLGDGSLIVEFDTSDPGNSMPAKMLV